MNKKINLIYLLSSISIVVFIFVNLYYQFYDVYAIFIVHTYDYLDTSVYSLFYTIVALLFILFFTLNIRLIRVLILQSNSLISFDKLLKFILLSILFIIVLILSSFIAHLLFEDIYFKTINIVIINSLIILFGLKLIKLVTDIKYKPTLNRYILLFMLLSLPHLVLYHIDNVSPIISSTFYIVYKIIVMYYFIKIMASQQDELNIDHNCSYDFDLLIFNVMLFLSISIFSMNYYKKQIEAQEWLASIKYMTIKKYNREDILKFINNLEQNKMQPSFIKFRNHNLSEAMINRIYKHRYYKKLSYNLWCFYLIKSLNNAQTNKLINTFLSKYNDKTYSLYELLLNTMAKYDNINIKILLHSSYFYKAPSWKTILYVDSKYKNEQDKIVYYDNFLKDKLLKNHRKIYLLKNIIDLNLACKQHKYTGIKHYIEQLIQIDKKYYFYFSYLRYINSKIDISFDKAFMSIIISSNYSFYTKDSKLQNELNYLYLYYKNSKNTTFYLIYLNNFIEFINPHSKKITNVKQPNKNIINIEYGDLKCHL